MTEDLNTLREALEIGRDLAYEAAQQFHATMRGYKPERHKAMDDDVAKIDKAIAALSRLEAAAVPEDNDLTLAYMAGHAKGVEDGLRKAEEAAAVPELSREDVVRLAREAGINADIGLTDKSGKYHPKKSALGKSVPIEWLERFASLVRSAPSTGETNAQLDHDSNDTQPKQQRPMAGAVALGQPVGGGSDAGTGHPRAERTQHVAAVPELSREDESFADYLRDCDKHAIAPDIAGAFAWAWRASLVRSVPSEAEQVCAQAYQVVGSLLSDVGAFETDEAEKILDNLSQAKMVHADVLPWPSFAVPVGEVKPVAWLVCSVNSDGSLILEHAAAWQEAAHEHINDAITEHGIEEAATWVVRPAYTTPPATPEGWRIVPVEPTPEMIAAWPNFRHGSGHQDQIYRAMLAAAPHPGDKA